MSGCKWCSFSKESQRDKKFTPMMQFCEFWNISQNCATGMSLHPCKVSEE